MVRRQWGTTVFVFGDNMERCGFGGQAAAMRGEPNAVGVPTKWAPGSAPADFFCDDDLKDLAVLFEGDAVTEFACRNHIEIPPILDYTYLYLFYRKVGIFSSPVRTFLREIC